MSFLILRKLRTEATLPLVSLPMVTNLIHRFPSFDPPRRSKRHTRSGDARERLRLQLGQSSWVTRYAVEKAASLGMSPLGEARVKMRRLRVSTSSWMLTGPSDACRKWNCGVTASLCRQHVQGDSNAEQMAKCCGKLLINHLRVICDLSPPRRRYTSPTAPFSPANREWGLLLMCQYFVLILDRRFGRGATCRYTTFALIIGHAPRLPLWQWDSQLRQSEGPRDGLRSDLRPYSEASLAILQQPFCERRSPAFQTRSGRHEPCTMGG